MIKRGLSQHLKVKIPKKEKSRQMMADGRVSLSKMVFGKREHSMTEYWMNATDTKAKLLTANIAGGLALASYYGYNHFTANPEVRASDSASRQNAIPDKLEELGSEFAMHREGKVKAHNYGMARRNSMRKATGGKKEFESEPVKVYRRNSMKKAGKKTGGSGQGGGNGKGSKPSSTGPSGNGNTLAAAAIAAGGVQIVRRDSEPPDDSDIDGGFFHVDGTAVNRDAMESDEALEHFPEFRAAGDGSDSAPKADNQSSNLGLIRRDSEPPDDSNFDEWHFKVDDTPLYNSDLTPEEVVAKQAEAKKLEVQYNSLVRRDSMPPDDSDIDGGFFHVDGTLTEATSEPATSEPVKSSSTLERRPSLEIASPITAALHRHLSQMGEQDAPRDNLAAAAAAANASTKKSTISRKMSVSEKKQRDTEAKQKAKRASQKAKRRASKKKSKKKPKTDWEKSVDRAKISLGKGDNHWVANSIGTPPLHADNVPKDQDDEDEADGGDGNITTTGQGNEQKSEKKAKTTAKPKVAEKTTKVKKPTGKKKGSKQDTSATESKNVAIGKHLSFRSLSSNPNLKQGEEDEEYIKNVTKLVRTASQIMKRNAAAAEEADDDDDEAATIFLPSQMI